ncbi:hypothetical protein BRC71_08225 [Halobacteriales archaeon QH_7_65_31]|nr:MAG: hypothetical protein BRC71_08225 [Halobacteriales archaeon QH_7_65_31]
MNVLVAATAEAGRDARERLRAAGFTVETVKTTAAARLRAATVDVVVAGPPSDGTETALIDTLTDTDTPVVRLDAASALPTLVRVADYHRRYRAAMDEFYEQSRSGGDPEPAAARADAVRAAARELAGPAPFTRLL